LPRSEVFGLANQLRRSSVSISSNIAEGHGKGRTGDYLRHLSIARGSLMELQTQLMIAGRLSFFDATEVEERLTQSDEVGRMLSSLIKALRRASQHPGPGP